MFFRKNSYVKGGNLMKFNRITALLCVVAMTASFFVMQIPVFAATGDVFYENATWNNQTWELKTFEDTSGNVFKSAFVDENNVLNVMAPEYMGALASDAKYYTATWSPATVTINQETGAVKRDYFDDLQELKALDGGDKNRNNDAFDLEFRMRFENKGQFYVNWYQSQIRMVMRNANTLMFKTSNENDYETVTVNMGTSWHDWKFEVRGVHVSVFMDGREIYSYNLFRQPAATRCIQFRTDYEYDYQGKIQVQDLKLTDRRTAVKLTKPLPYSASKNKLETFNAGESLALEADAGATADYDSVDVMVNEDFSSSDIDFNDGVKFKQATGGDSENCVVESVNGYMHFFKSIQKTTVLEEDIMLPSASNDTVKKDFIFEYDIMIPDSSVWNQTTEDEAFMYFDIFRSYPETSLRQSMFLLKDRMKIGSTSFWYKNICGTSDFGGIWMSFKHCYYYDEDNATWNCDFYYKKQSDKIWNLHQNATMNTKQHTQNYIRIYAYAEDQVEVCFDNMRVYTGAHVDGETFKTVDFYVNGIKVGSGVDTASTNASYTLDEGLPAGKHIITAVSEGVASAETIIYVTDSAIAEIVCNEEIAYGETATASVSCSAANADSVIYYVDGESIGKFGIDEAVTITNLSVGTHSVDAVLYCADGTNINTDEKYINVTATADAVKTAKINREYRLDYVVTGSGEVTVNDGYFTLDLTHNADGSVTYGTIDNERKTISKTYKGLGDGNYRIVATAGNAEVYYNGQLAFSMLMPYTGKTETLINHSGGVSGVSICGSGVKATRAERILDNEAEVEIYNVDFDKFYSVEFDKNSADDETIMIYDGTYEAVVELGGEGVVVNNQLTTSAPTDKKVLAESTPTGYYRITVGEGMAQLFVDNVIVGTWRCPLNAHRKAVIRHITDPASTTFVAVKNTDDVYYHYEDFDDSNNEDGFGWKDYWYAQDVDFYTDDERNDSAVGNVYRNFTYGTENGKLVLGDEGEYILNVNADQPKLSWDGAYTQTDGTGDGFEIRTKYMKDFLYVSVGYDYETKIWTAAVVSPQTIYYDEDGNRLGAYNSNEEWVDAPVKGAKGYPLATAQYDIGESTHHFDLMINDDVLTFKIDGNIILECGELYSSYEFDEKMADGNNVSYEVSNNRTHGRIAFFNKFGKTTVDNLSYEGDGRAMPGLYSETNIPTFDFYKSFTGKIAGSARGTTSAMVSEDGKSWTLLDYLKDTGNQLSTNTINLSSGNLLRIYYASYIEADGSKYSYTFAHFYDKDTTNSEHTKYTNRVMIEAPGSMYGVPYSGMGSRLVQLKTGEYAGRVLYTRGGSGEEKGQVFLYYSDDYKEEELTKTPQWHEPNVQFNFDNTGGTILESQIVEMPDGVVRCYIRSDKGYLSYFESFDGGATWDPSVCYTENLIMPSCCYSIKRVGETETYFAFFEYDTVTTDLYYLEHPRNRSAMAVSYDGMKTWEYVGEMEERGISASSGTCNNGMTIVDNLVFATYHSTPHRVFVQDMNKVKPLKRFSSLHPRTSKYMATTLEEQRTDFCVIPKETGEAYIYGNYMSAEVNPSGFAEGSVLAKIGGAKVTSADDSGVTITLGESTIRFNDGMMGYTMNGSYINCGTLCCEGKYLNTKVVAELFGKKVIETDDAYMVVDEIPSDSLINQFENMGSTQSLETVRLNNLLMDINTASRIGDGAGIDAVFVKYNDLLNVSFEDLLKLEDQSNVFRRMTGIEYRTVADVENAFEKAVDAQKKAEGQETAVALSSVSGAFDQWSMLGKNKGTAESTDGILTMTVAKGVDETYVYGTPGLDIPKDNYIFTFDYKTVSGDCEAEFRLGNTSELVKFNVSRNSITVYGAYSKTTEVTLEQDKWYTFVGTMENGMLTLMVTDGAEYSKTICEGLEMEENTLTRGFWTAMDGSGDAKAQLRNVRVYTGKAIDVITHTTADGKVSATVDFLNDGEAASVGQFIVGVYNGGVQAGVGATAAQEGVVEAFGARRYSVEGVDYVAKEGINPNVKFFIWDGIDTMVPIAEAVGK